MPTVVLAARFGALRQAVDRLRRWSARPGIAVQVLRGSTDHYPAGAVVVALRCPYCLLWTAPRRFDTRHMACRPCRDSLARSVVVVGKGLR